MLVAITWLFSMGNPYLGERDGSMKGSRGVSESSEALVKSGGRL